MNKKYLQKQHKPLSNPQLIQILNWVNKYEYIIYRAYIQLHIRICIVFTYVYKEELIQVTWNA